MMKTARTFLPILLTVSVMVNMLLIGMIIGGALGKERRPPPPQFRDSHFIGALRDLVAEEDRTRIRTAFRETWADNREQFRQGREARKKVREALLADPYDPEALKAAFEAVRALEDSAERAIQDTLADQLASVSPEVRRQLDEVVSSRRPGRRHGLGRPRPDGRRDHDRRDAEERGLPRPPQD